MMRSLERATRDASRAQNLSRVGPTSSKKCCSAQFLALAAALDGPLQRLELSAELGDVARFGAVPRGRLRGRVVGLQRDDVARTGRPPLLRGHGRAEEAKQRARVHEG